MRHLVQLSGNRKQEMVVCAAGGWVAVQGLVHAVCWEAPQLRRGGASCARMGKSLVQPSVVLRLVCRAPAR